MNNLEAERFPSVSRTVSGGVRYLVKPVNKILPLGHPEFAESWQHAGIADVWNFHTKSSSHRPKTQVRCLYGPRDLHIWFHVRDRYVRCVHTDYQSRVSQDSCVEFFLTPISAHPKSPEKVGYFNFEVNCGGTMLLYYITDNTRRDDRLFESYVEVPEVLGKLVSIEHSMPRIVDPEIQSDVSWDVVLKIPFEVMEAFVGPLKAENGTSWRANFFKCGDATSHPHWASWSDIGETLRFHQTAHFGWCDFGA